jgi:lysozyme family protein
MLNVAQVAAEIVAREGGYVNDPDDPGGPTKYGVTLATLRRLNRDLTGDRRVTEADIRALTEAEAARIFVDQFFKAPGLDRLPEAIQPSVFDMYVNSGANAVRILQRLLCDMRMAVDVDGVIGPQTALAAGRAQTAAAGFFADAYGIARRNYYYALGDARPASRKYCRRRDGGKGGWILRAEAFIAPKYHLTEAEHRARVAGWA